jgi:hypothetical protein
MKEPMDAMSRPIQLMHVRRWSAARSVAALFAFTVAGLAFRSEAPAGVLVAPRATQAGSTGGVPLYVEPPEASALPAIDRSLADPPSFLDVDEPVAASHDIDRALALDVDMEPTTAAEMTEFANAPSLLVQSAPVMIPSASASWAGVGGMLLVATVLASRRLQHRVLG